MKNRVIYFFILFVLFMSPIYSQNKVIKIWPGLAPGTENRTDNERIENGNVTNVYQPSLAIFLPGKVNTNKPAVIVMPGGGYKQVVMRKEGYVVADWLN
jgi:acetyl esterase/lipase